MAPVLLAFGCQSIEALLEDGLVAGMSWSVARPTLQRPAQNDKAAPRSLAGPAAEAWLRTAPLAPRAPAETSQVALQMQQTPRLPH